MENIIETHHDMVLRLKKPAVTILDSLTPWDCDLVHMAGCLPGEAAELYDAITIDGVELLEELGDFAFYLVAVRNLLGIDEWTGVVGGVGQTSSPERNAIHLMRLGGHFWDIVKRIVIYRKGLDGVELKYSRQTPAQAAKGLLEQMENRFNSIITHYNYSLEDVLEANYHKLANADTGRYAQGTYSDQQAQERRDKAEDNTSL